MFILSLKQPLFARLRAQLGTDAGALGDAMWNTTVMLDRLALFTTEVYQKSREEVISRQQQELMELSTPVVELWTGILALPLIGTLDSARTQVVMESLLASHRPHRRIDRDHRHHRRADRRHAGRATSAEDRRSGAPRWARTASSAASARRSRRPSCISASIFRRSPRKRRSRMPSRSRCARPVRRSALLPKAAALTPTPWRRYRSCGWAGSCWSPFRSTCTIAWPCSFRTI